MKTDEQPRVTITLTAPGVSMSFRETPERAKRLIEFGLQCAVDAVESLNLPEPGFGDGI